MLDDKCISILLVRFAELELSSPPKRGMLKCEEWAGGMPDDFEEGGGEDFFVGWV